MGQGWCTMVIDLLMQALGPVALVSLLLNTGLSKAVPGSDINENPNLPDDPELQERFNRAAVQVTSCCCHLTLRHARQKFTSGDQGTR